MDPRELVLSPQYRQRGARSEEKMHGIQAQVYFPSRCADCHTPWSSLPSNGHRLFCRSRASSYSPPAAVSTITTSTVNGCQCPSLSSDSESLYRQPQASKILKIPLYLHIPSKQPYEYVYRPSKQYTDMLCTEPSTPHTFPLRSPISLSSPKLEMANPGDNSPRVGSRCHLLSIPTELRLRILKYTMSTKDILILPKYYPEQQRGPTGNGSIDAAARSMKQYPIRQVCRQLNEELEDVLQRNSQLVIQTAKFSPEYLPERLRAGLLSYIRKITIDINYLSNPMPLHPEDFPQLQELHIRLHRLVRSYRRERSVRDEWFQGKRSGEIRHLVLESARSCIPAYFTGVHDSEVARRLAKIPADFISRTRVAEIIFDPTRKLKVMVDCCITLHFANKCWLLIKWLGNIDSGDAIDHRCMIDDHTIDELNPSIDFRRMFKEWHQDAPRSPIPDYVMSTCQVPDIVRKSPCWTQAMRARLSRLEAEEAQFSRDEEEEEIRAASLQDARHDAVMLSRWSKILWEHSLLELKAQTLG